MFTKKMVAAATICAATLLATPSMASISQSERGRCVAAAALATTFGPVATVLVGGGCLMMADV